MKNKDKKILVIGLTGKKYSGKTTASLMIQDELIENGYSVFRVNFKDALIEKIMNVFPKTLTVIFKFYRVVQFWKYKEEIDLFLYKPPIMRALMQEVGTDVYRNDFGEDFWVNEWKKSIANIKKYSLDIKIAIIADDVRFFNEKDAVEKAKGIIISIDSDRCVKSNDTHQSEVEQESFTFRKKDFVIQNNGTKEDLKNTIKDVITNIV